MSVPVKLPKEVLNLFPVWESRCPCCGAYVESNKSFCPKCKTAFDENRWRVPPRFLRSPEAMSEYAHKVLAPKLTRKQCELLFKYFTELFSDGFESGDFSAWTGTSTTPPAIDTDSMHCGTYSMLCNAGVRHCYRDVAAQDHLNFRVYVKWSALPSAPQDRIMLVRDGTTQILRVFYHWSAALFPVNEVGFSLYNDVKGGYVGHYDVDVGTDDWVCVEVEYDNGAEGYCKLYVDGTERISESYDFGSQQASRVFCIHDHNSSFNVNFDCAVVADTHIGPETAEQTYTRTWATDVLFKKLGITETFSVDAALQRQDIPKTFGLDSAFQKSILAQKQIDALFKRFDIPKSFALDARFGALVTQIVSRQIDVLLKKLDATKAFGLDAYFGAAEAQAYTETFGLDVVFAYKVRLPELWLDENGRMVLNISEPYTWVGA